jgi:hypothetical protein
MLFVSDSIQLVHQTPYLEAVEGFEDLKLGGQVICTVKCADDRKLNPGMPWLKQLSEGRRLFSPANWT